jgi:DNA polymerase III epsilon subunit-like protein
MSDEKTKDCKDIKYRKCNKDEKYRKYSKDEKDGETFAMIFDLETTGFPERINFSTYYDYKLSNKYENSRIVQIAYILIDRLGNEIKRVSHIVKPKGYDIPDDMIHGITHEMANRTGKSFSDIVKELSEDLSQVKVLVCHNAVFDKNVFMAELYRRKKYHTLECFSKLDVFCTGEKSKNVCNIKIGKLIKMPSLKEAYTMIVKKPINIKLHDALNDCELCGEIYKVLSIEH